MNVNIFKNQIIKSSERGITFNVKTDDYIPWICEHGETVENLMW